MSKIYHTHYRCFRPFKVEIKNNNVTVINTSRSYYNQNIELEISSDRIFIPSPDKEYEIGNTILLQSGVNQYIFIHREFIKTFSSISEIVIYESPIIGDDEPIPYAIDKLNNVYLLEEEVILMDYRELNYFTPYEYYLHKRIISNMSLETGLKYGLDKIPLKYIAFGNAYPFTYDEPALLYSPFPSEYYDTNMKENGDCALIYDDGGIEIEYSKSDYIKLSNIYGEIMNFRPLIITDLGG